ncbi:MAG: hypothetical protein JSS24_14760, partial [Proteobacteria bacterium]|nr:hypothetical protein [Pseudomonadota bacterium]
MSAENFLISAGEELQTTLSKAINADYLGDETRIVRRSADLARLAPERAEAVRRAALDL